MLLTAWSIWQFAVVVAPRQRSKSNAFAGRKRSDIDAARNVIRLHAHRELGNLIDAANKVCETDSRKSHALTLLKLKNG